MRRTRSEDVAREGREDGGAHPGDLDPARYPRHELDGFDALMHPAERLIERRAARELGSEDDLGPVFLPHAREEIAEAGETEDRAFVAARSPDGPSRLVQRARDHG